jgi:hypothetical protein
VTISNYSASVSLSSGQLSVTRPSPAPQAVDDLIDNVVYTVRDPGSTVRGVGLTIALDEATGTMSVSADQTTIDQPQAEPAPEPDSGGTVSGPLPT